MNSPKIQLVPFEIRLLQALIEGWTINGRGYIFYFCCECQKFIRIENNNGFPSMVSHGYCPKCLADMYKKIGE